MPQTDRRQGRGPQRPRFNSPLRRLRARRCAGGSDGGCSLLSEAWRRSSSRGSASGSSPTPLAGLRPRARPSSRIRAVLAAVALEVKEAGGHSDRRGEPGLGDHPLVKRCWSGCSARSATGRLADQYGFELSTETEWEVVALPDGRVVQRVEVIKSALEVRRDHQPAQVQDPRVHDLHRRHQEHVRGHPRAHQGRLPRQVRRAGAGSRGMLLDVASLMRPRLSVDGRHRGHGGQGAGDRRHAAQAGAAPGRHRHRGHRRRLLRHRRVRHGGRPGAGRRPGARSLGRPHRRHPHLRACPWPTWWCRTSMPLPRTSAGRRAGRAVRGRDRAGRCCAAASAPGPVPRWAPAPSAARASRRARDRPSPWTRRPGWPGWTTTSASAATAATRSVPTRPSSCSSPAWAG